MSTQYWIGGFFIDLSRNQITQNNQTQTLAPKALAVLTHLAENQGKVISQDDLLTVVWQDTAVSPNTLQKSIAQLRKALGNEGSIYIKTHAKKGYSLECDVRWQNTNFTDEPAENTEISAPIKIEHSKKQSNYALGWLTLFVAIFVFGLVSFTNSTQQQAPMLSFGKLRALTSTDNKEIASIYSPDGQYVVFHRFSVADCVNNIWAKNTQTQEEIQLTKDFDAYGHHTG